MVGVNESHVVKENTGERNSWTVYIHHVYLTGHIVFMCVHMLYIIMRCLSVWNLNDMMKRVYSIPCTNSWLFDNYAWNIYIYTYTYIYIYIYIYISRYSVERIMSRITWYNGSKCALIHGDILNGTAIILNIAWNVPTVCTVSCAGFPFRLREGYGTADPNLLSVLSTYYGPANSSDVLLMSLSNTSCC